MKWLLIRILGCAILTTAAHTLLEKFYWESFVSTSVSQQVVSPYACLKRLAYTRIVLHNNQKLWEWILCRYGKIIFEVNKIIYITNIGKKLVSTNEILNILSHFMLDANISKDLKFLHRLQNCVVTIFYHQKLLEITSGETYDSATFFFFLLTKSWLNYFWISALSYEIWNSTTSWNVCMSYLVHSLRMNTIITSYLWSNFALKPIGT